MALKGIKTLPEFNHIDPNTGAREWETYKRDFLVHLDALGLDDKPGKRKVGMLLANMGREAVKIYDSFTWAPAVEADEDNNIAGQPGEDRHDLDTVFRKFDRHFGVHNYRNIKRQEFLNTKRGKNTIMDYISELKRKAEFCEYGEQKEGLICDMIINGVSDRKCSEKLMEIPAADLNLDRVIQTCRQVELTNAHLKNLDAENPTVHLARTRRVKSRAYQQPTQRGGYQGSHPFCKRCCKHHRGNCPAYDKYCDTCGQKGHYKLSSLCRVGAAPIRSARRGRSNFRGRGHGHPQNVYYAEDTPTRELGEMFDQCTVQDVWVAIMSTKDRSSEWKVTFNVGEKKLTLDIDSGAQCNILSKASAEKFVAIAPITDSDVIISGVSTKVKSYGQINLPCKYRDMEKVITFQVIDSERSMQLLERKDSLLFGLIARVNSVDVSVTTEQLKNDYADVIGQDIGCLPVNMR